MFTEENRKKIRVGIYLFFIIIAGGTAGVGAILHWTGTEKCGIVAFCGLSAVFGLVLGLIVRPSDFYILARPDTGYTNPNKEDEGNVLEMADDIETVRPRVAANIKLK